MEDVATILKRTQGEYKGDEKSLAEGQEWLHKDVQLKGHWIETPWRGKQNVPKGHTSFYQ